jgi:hypothetical protein
VYEYGLQNIPTRYEFLEIKKSYQPNETLILIKQKAQQGTNFPKIKNHTSQPNIPSS